ncbi:hypothetical protein BC941DRAFT_411921 [Chlamydoabsidia padenii]|nr:hypothetical protein BC941DRAFT_411921 [Chlamydoabsidia padenii]
MTTDNGQLPLAQRSFHIRKSLKELAHRPRINHRQKHSQIDLPLPSLPSHLSAKDNYVYDVLYECQRGSWLVGYSSKTLLQFDPNPWCDVHMRYTPMNPTTYQLPDPTWEWVSKEWMVDMTDDVDEAGWQYSIKFHGAVWHGNYKHFRSFVRRRRWIRLRHHVNQLDKQQQQQQQLNSNGQDDDVDDTVKTRQLIKVDDNDREPSSQATNNIDLVEKLKTCRLDRERRSVFDSLLTDLSSSQLNSLLADSQKVKETY